jgi:hypothetical protein
MVLAMLLTKECSQTMGFRVFCWKEKDKLIYDTLCVYQENYDNVMRL